MEPHLSHSQRDPIPSNDSVSLSQTSLEKLIRLKLGILFEQQKESRVEITGLHSLIVEQVERPLIELALQTNRGNQLKTALVLGMNRNTLKKKMDHYRIKARFNNRV